MKRVVIVAALRSPIGKYKGALAQYSAVDLGTKVTQTLLSRYPKVKDDVKQVIFGNVLQAGNGQNVARQISINSGLSYEVPATTVNEVCGSGMKAVIMAWQSLQLGQGEVAIAGGTESMTNAPQLRHFNYETNEYGDPLSAMILDGLTDAFSHKHMGLTAEKVAKEFHISRDEQDEFALNSQKKAAKAKAKGFFSTEIVPFETKQGLMTQDEGIRADSSIEKLSQLRTVFKENGTVTAGNASTINDGAAVLLLATKEYADLHNLPYLTEICGFSEVGIDPAIMGVAPIKAVTELLTAQDKTIADIDLFEINEAFAASSVAVERKLGLDSKKVNPYGGGISLGHAIGATGARLLTTLSHQLQQEDKEYGIASLCIGGGLGLAMLLKSPSKENSPKKFYQMNQIERLEKLQDNGQINPNQATELLHTALDSEIANHMIENQISEIETPMGLALNLIVNDKEYSVPLATEEPSVIAACSYGAKMAEKFTAVIKERLLRGQIVFYDIADEKELTKWLENNQELLFEIANASYPSIVKRGGGLKEISWRKIEGNYVSFDLKIDVKDAMGANIVNGILEGIAAKLRQIFPNEKILFSILSNLATESLVEVSCRVPVANLAKSKIGGNGKEIAEKIAIAAAYAKKDPYRAATHNKGIMNGIDGVILATGNDTRAVAAGVHAYAVQNGQYQGLSDWKIVDDYLEGRLVLPLAIATAGGATKVLPKARAALSILAVQDAKELAAVVAAVGLAQNLAALRALVSEGIQKGHMALQSRSLAMTVGAVGSEIEAVSQKLQKETTMNQATAAKILASLRENN
ncbi:hydroxymethylglutaryl-CoA reductase, degradative [Enterococcus saigonensis]|uniref:acetyl-CoA C-acetyltransferase n=1 Tax=Enterococcus saigonensis TaxID=1805431 RepID=A0A679ICX1_9ENTE|nr:hydroxymethylglutaryl-CoA reductase, degradative [Enterococcus saigonensis]BCA86059.1 hydroxymethylglutaryl-CoA reductase, degradative [Enterococcus saigonensis]